MAKAGAESLPCNDTYREVCSIAQHEDERVGGEQCDLLVQMEEALDGFVSARAVISRPGSCD